MTTVVGIDVGQRSLGLAIHQFHAGDLSSEIVTRSFYAENTFVSRYAVAQRVLKIIKDSVDYVDLVCIEEYAKMGQSFVAFGMGEHGGIYRTLCYDRQWPMILCCVPWMRGFFDLKRGSNSKEQLSLVLAELYPNHVWSTNKKKGREDEIDAIGYALIGQCFLNPTFFELTTKQQWVIDQLNDTDVYYIGKARYESS